MKKGLYKYKNRLYTLIGSIKSKNSNTREWEIHVLYVSISGGETYSREKKDFMKKFDLIIGEY